MRPSAARPDRGTATAELAVAVPGLLLVLAVALSAVQLGIDRVRCVDAAQVGARWLARGESVPDTRAAVARAAPEGAAVTLAPRGPTVSVVVRAPVPALLRWVGVPLQPAARAVARSEDAP